jgi:hypothetical protein
MRNSPEPIYVLFAFLMHFFWEMAQAPLFSGLPERTHREGLIVCGIATLGDVVIALLAFWTVSAMNRSRLWHLHPTGTDWVVYLGVGLGITAAYEILATRVLNRWSYAETMPTLPVVGIGLVPILQWILVPPIVLWLTRCHMRGCAAGGSVTTGTDQQYRKR